MIKINLLENSKGKNRRGGGGTVDAHDGNGRYGLAQTESPGGSGSRWTVQPGLLVPAGRSVEGHRGRT